MIIAQDLGKYMNIWYLDPLGNGESTGKREGRTMNWKLGYAGVDRDNCHYFCLISLPQTNMEPYVAHFFKDCDLCRLFWGFHASLGEATHVVVLQSWNGYTLRYFEIILVIMKDPTVGVHV